MSIRTTVYRTRLDLAAAQPAMSVSLPAGARFVAAQRREHRRVDLIDLWAEVDPAAELTAFPVWIVGTGNAEVPPAPARYLNTVQVADGALVFHIYVDDTDHRSGVQRAVVGDTAPRP